MQVTYCKSAIWANRFATAVQAFIVDSFLSGSLAGIAGHPVHAFHFHICKVSLAHACSVVVLGGGPGGYAAAFLAADEGLDVTIVEAEPRLGGTCLLRGCIPSKALLHVAKVISEVEELREEWGVVYDESPKIDIDKVRARKDKVISNLTGGLGQLPAAAT